MDGRHPFADAGANGDNNPVETREWLDSFDAVLRSADSARALYLLQQLEAHAKNLGLLTAAAPYSAYRNTIPIERQGPYPGDLAIE
jgi:pyruvate dehydrogenase E1 component